MNCIVMTPVKCMVLAASLLLALGAVEGRAATAVGTTQPLSPEIVLPRLNAIDLTVSGLSSGGYMAVQMQVAHSASINGSAIFAGGPYYCAESDLRIAETRCMRNFRDHTGTSVARLVKYTNDASVVGTIDDTAHLKSARAYVFSGTLDTVIDSSVGHALVDYYDAFLLDSNTQLKSTFNLPAEHCMPTLQWGEPCDVLTTPFMGLCDFDGAGTALQHLLPNVHLSRSDMIDKNFIAFDQNPFKPPNEPMATSIGDTGFAYVPAACRDDGATCHVHVSLHGCEQNVESIGDVYARHSGLNEWAEGTGNIIVVYPYVRATPLYPTNPNGCWDWWGYTNELYGLRGGVQVQFIRNVMVAVGAMQ